MSWLYYLDNIENIKQIFYSRNCGNCEPYQVGNYGKRSEKRKTENKNHPIGWLTNLRFAVYWNCEVTEQASKLQRLGGGIFVHKQ